MHVRRLTTALAAAAVALSPILASPASFASAPSEGADRVADASLTMRDAELLRPVVPPTLRPSTSAPTVTARASRRPLFAFWGKKYNRIDGFGFQTAVRGSGTSIQLGVAWKTYRGVRPILPKKVFVQARVDGGSWAKVAGARGRIGKKGYVLAQVPAYVVPAGVPAQTVDYRLKTKKITSGPRKARRSVTSKPVSVRFDNQTMYTGDQARFYAPIATLCPNASVTLDTDHTIAEKRDAVFSFQYGIAIDVAEINAITWESEASKQAVAIHECAHWRQFYNWGGTLKGFDAMEKRSAEIFVADTNPDPNVPTPPNQPDWAPLEHAADCATFLATSGAQRTYGGYCNPTENAAAGLLWQGQQY
jgi:hypothetical protein